MVLVRRFLFIVLGGGLFAGSAFSEASTANQEEKTINPSTTYYATRGLTQISSAEALGAGRFTVGILGSWYQQRRNYAHAPDSNAHIITGIGSMSFGLNPYVDLFGSVAA